MVKKNKIKTNIFILIAGSIIFSQLASCGGGSDDDKPDPDTIAEASDIIDESQDSSADAEAQNDDTVACDYRRVCRQFC